MICLRIADGGRKPWKSSSSENPHPRVQRKSEAVYLSAPNPHKPSPRGDICEHADRTVTSVRLWKWGRGRAERRRFTRAGPCFAERARISMVAIRWRLP